MKVLYGVLLLTILSCNKKTPIITYFDNGKIEEQYFTKNGNRHGKYTRYNENGSLDLEGFYKDGLEHGTFLLYHGDIVQLSYQSENGKLNGHWRLYNISTGNLFSEDTYRDDKLNGLCQRFYVDGTLKYKCVFKDDKPYNGIWTQRILTIEILENGDTLRSYGNENLLINLGEEGRRLYRYINGKKENTKLTLREDKLVRLGRRYQTVVDTKDKNIYHLKKKIKTSYSYMEGLHGDGEMVLDKGKLIFSEEDKIEIIDSMSFKILKKVNSYIVIEGSTEDDIYFRDSIKLEFHEQGFYIMSHFIPDTSKSYDGLLNDYRNLILID